MSFLSLCNRYSDILLYYLLHPISDLTFLTLLKFDIQYILFDIFFHSFLNFSELYFYKSDRLYLSLAFGYIYTITLLSAELSGHLFSCLFDPDHHMWSLFLYCFEFFLCNTHYVWS